MKTKLTEIISAIKTMKPRDFIYTGISFVFLGIVITVFLFSLEFISKNINRVFTIPETGNTLSLDVARYNLVAKKLNIPTNTSSEPSLGYSATSTNISATSTILKKSTVTILILNSTQKQGVASTLAKKLKDIGFTNITTGNEKIPQTLTTILVRENQRDYADAILESISKAYPTAQISTTTKQTKSDIIITIGGK